MNQINTIEEQLLSENKVMRQLVINQGGNFTLTSHAVKTSDGYLLKVFRIYPVFLNMR